MNWLERVPRSGIALLGAYLLVGGVIFALQLIPVIGIILMVLAAPFWIGLLAHVAMANFTLLALTRSISIAWLVLPLGFYGGGLALHHISVRAAEAEAAAINERNAALRLTVDQPFRYLRDGRADSFPLIEHYRVDRSFVRNGMGAFTTTYYARGSDCDNAHQGYNFKLRFEPSQFRKNIFYYYQGETTRQCILSQDVLSADWRYRIKAEYTYTNTKDRASSLFIRYGRSFEIFDDKENRLLGTIEVATFTPYPVIPWIVVGCALDSGAPAWKCGWELWKSGDLIAAGYKQRPANDPQKNPFIPSLDPETWEITQLARALGLERRGPTD